MKLGSAQITTDMLIQAGTHYTDLRGVCQYLNEKRPDIQKKDILQISPPHTNAIGAWIVIYLWEG